MPRIKDSRPLHVVNVPDKVSFLLILLLSVATTSLFGQETVKMLAMVCYDQPSVRIPSAFQADSATNSVYDLSIPLLQYRLEALRLDPQSDAGFSTNSRLERPEGTHQRDLFQFVHKRFCTTGRTDNWLNIEAGYGQISHAEYSFEACPEELQRPGFAYLKASLSF